MKLYPYLAPYKSNSKWIKNLNIRTIKKNIGENLMTSNLAMDRKSTDNKNRDK